MEMFWRYRLGVFFYCIVISNLFLTSLGNPLTSLRNPLQEDFYSSSCPSAEASVRRIVFKAYRKNPGVAAGLIRLHFHDCFVRGCDASVLLDSTPNNSAEKDALPNLSLSIQGMEVIDTAKALFEKICPQTVSCSDILAFTARDSAFFAGGFYYDVPAGRRDGNVSLEAEVLQNLPPPFFNATQLQANFAAKGMSLDEMVTLSGAHSIGLALCVAFANRLYAFNSTLAQDPSLNPRYAKYLKNRCPPSTVNINASQNLTVSLDFLSPDRLDNKYYKGLTQNLGLMQSDQTLYSSDLTTEIVKRNAMNPRAWANKFMNAMVHMGSLGVLTGSQGEIRSNCRVAK